MSRNPSPRYKPYDSQRQPSQEPPKPKPQTENHHPWRRFFARTLDYVCGGLIVGAVIWLFNGIGLLHPKTVLTLSNQFIAGMVICFVWMLLEPVIIGLFGNTPGKKLLGLKIVSNSQQPDYMKRAFSVWVRGVGLGLPFVLSFTAAMAYFSLKKTGKTSWDKDYGFTVEAEPIDFFRVAVAIIVILLCIVADKEYRYALNTSSVSRQATQGVKPYSGSSIPDQDSTVLKPNSGPSIKDNEVATNASNLPADARTQFNWGLAYEKGDGISQNYAEAVKWYRMAAEQGYAKAQSNLGLLYNNGQGIPQNYAEAAKWWLMAAEQGNVRAQYNLGLLYERGLGVLRNHDEAAKWWLMAAKQGLKEAQYTLGVLYAKGEGITQNYAEAEKWYRMASDQGYAAAQNNLGFLYQNGHGVLQDLDEAARWYRMAADQGYAEAQDKLN